MDKPPLCERCEVKPVRRRADGNRPYRKACDSCTDQGQAARKQLSLAARRQWLDALKLARGCADCGYNAHPAALDFDHLPGLGKRYAISRFKVATISDKALEAELARCELVCANCHRIRTALRGQYRRGA